MGDWVFLAHASGVWLEAAHPNPRRSFHQMRHPNVVVFKESLEIEEKGEHVIYLVTEPVTPLASFLETTELTGQDRCGPGC